MSSKNISNNLETYNLKEFTRGWIVGRFSPSLLDYASEVGVQSYQAGDIHPAHVHFLSKEINVVLSGVCEIEGTDIGRLQDKDFKRERFGPGDIFIIDPGYAIQFMAITDCQILVIRSGSNPKDKIVINPDHWS